MKVQLIKDNSMKTVTTQGPKKGRVKKILLKTFIVIVIFLLLGLGFIYWYDSAGQKPDKTFDASVKNPAYTSFHPEILFDTAHNNFPAGLSLK